MKRFLRASLAAAAVLFAAGAATSDPPPSWAFVVGGKGPDWPAGKPVRATGSKLSVPLARFNADKAIADWFPEDHPKVPDVVLRGRKGIEPCAACHKLNGVGESDNAALAGLPAGYIVQQFAEFRSGRRGCAEPHCAKTMHDIAQAISPAEVQAVADYFSKTPYRPRFKVVEAAMVPKVEIVWYTYMAVKGSKQEPIGQRILEMPDDLSDYLAANWRAPMTVYVPPGSIARGKTLVEGGAGPMACAACHGDRQQGMGDTPPLAGRSPSTIYRQLYNIQHGYRKGPAVAPMIAVVAHLKPEDRLAIAAYLASMKP